MDTPPLLSGDDVKVIAGAIVVGLGAIAGVLRWAGGRFVKALDEMAAESKQTGKDLVELRGVVREGRDDIREIRDGLAAALAPAPADPSERRRPRHQVATSPLGVRPIRRTAPDET